MSSATLKCGVCGTQYAVRLGMLVTDPGQCPNGCLSMFSRAGLPRSVDDVKREADRIVALWGNLPPRHPSFGCAGQVRLPADYGARARMMLVGKAFDVPFAPSSGWAVCPELQTRPPPRWRTRVVLDIHLGGPLAIASLPPVNAMRALVVGIDHTRPTVWAPVHWLRPA